MTVNTEFRYMNYISKALKDQNASIMIGAGFSGNARYYGNKDNKMLNWNELGEKFYDLLYGNSNNKKGCINPIALAEEVEIMYGRQRLNDIIRESLPDMEHSPSDIHYKMLELPWRDIFTTNYDTLLERASLDIINRDYLVINNKEDLVYSAKSSRIIKLHGSFPSYTPFIITEEDYRRYPTDFAPFVNTVQQALLENTFCMIGFSGTDPNFLSWLGWLSDSYHNKVAQKIYLISVNGENEIQKEKLKSKNIIVLDLEKMWPEEDSETKIINFLSRLDNTIRKEDQISWTNKNDLEELYKISSMEDELTEKILDNYAMFMRNIVELYPGWIALPERYKSLSSYLLRELIGILFKLRKSEANVLKQTNFLYEYVRLKDICNRPILKEEIPIIEDIIDKIIEDKNDNHKVNVIKIMLLRTYRELGLKEKFDILIKYIDGDTLDDHYNSFLNYEECMMELHSLNLSKFKEKVLKWDVGNYDYYWMLMKISLLIMFGDYERCEEMSIDTLNNLRKIRYKILNLELVRNQSIEDCLVKLTNHIRQAIRPLGEDSQYEETKIKNAIKNENYFDWFRENGAYISSFRFEYKDEGYARTHPSFDLGYKKRSVSFKNENEILIESLEYLRFREITGTPFVIGNVTSKKGIVEVIRRILDYNPGLSLTTFLKANESEGLEYMYGRKFMNELNMVEADWECEKILDLINNYLIEEINKKNWVYSRNILDYSANLLPTIISRLITKCSLATRDKVLKTCLNIYSSYKVRNFKKMNKLVRRLVTSYTNAEFIDRLPIFLEFPVADANDIEGYPDPLSLINLKRTFPKTALDNESYEHVIKQVFWANDINNKNKLQRMICIYFLIELKEKENKKLEDIIWNGYNGKGLPLMGDLFQLVLMDLPHSRYIKIEELDNKLKENAILKLKNESIEKKDSNLPALKMINELMKKNVFITRELEYITELLIKISAKYKKGLESLEEFDPFSEYDEIKSNIKFCGRIVCQVLLYYSNEISNKIIDNINKLIVILLESQIYLPSLKILYELVINKNTNIMPIINEAVLYNRDDEFIDVIFTFNLLVDINNLEIINDIKYAWLEVILKRICIINDGYQGVKNLANVVEKLSKEEINSTSRYLSIILKKSLQYVDIQENDDETTAIEKTIYKKEMSRLVKLLWNKEINDSDLKKLIDVWKEKCVDEDEFAEVRKYWIE